MTGLEFCNLCFSYRNRPILQNVSFKVKEASFCALLGANGAGKSTLVRCTNALLRPRQGRVLWKGTDTGQLSIKERARIYGYVPQSTQVRAGLNVMETVLSGRLPHMGHTAGREDIGKALEIIESLGLSEFAFRPLHQLSGGERQRVLIARALAQEPQVLLLDEPISNLDLRYQYDLMQLLQGLSRGKGICVVAVIHDLNIALDYADQVVLLHQGAVFAQGRPENILTAEAIETVFHIKAELARAGERFVILPAR